MPIYFQELQSAFDPATRFSGDLSLSRRSEDLDDISEIFGCRPWPEVEFSKLKQRRDTYMLLTPKAQVFYLPAMAMALEADTDMTLDVLYDYFMSIVTPYSGPELRLAERWALVDTLSTEQKEVLAKLVVRINERLPEAFPDKADLVRQAYWSRV